jgi:hypothetical protein
MKVAIIGFWISVLVLIGVVYVQDTVIARQAKFIQQVMQDPNCNGQR